MQEWFTTEEHIVSNIVRGDDSIIAYQSNVWTVTKS